MYSKTGTWKSTKSSLAELRSALDQAEAVFKGLARCMKKAAAVTSSRMPSSKGVLV